MQTSSNETPLTPRTSLIGRQMTTVGKLCRTEPFGKGQGCFISIPLCLSLLWTHVGPLCRAPLSQDTKLLSHRTSPWKGLTHLIIAKHLCQIINIKQNTLRNAKGVSNLIFLSQEKCMSEWAAASEGDSLLNFLFNFFFLLCFFFFLFICSLISLYSLFSLIGLFLALYTIES